MTLSFLFGLSAPERKLSRGLAGRKLPSLFPLPELLLAAPPNPAKPPCHGAGMEGMVKPAIVVGCVYVAPVTEPGPEPDAEERGCPCWSWY